MNWVVQQTKYTQGLSDTMYVLLLIANYFYPLANEVAKG